jgi:hypothetical protein
LYDFLTGGIGARPAGLPAGIAAAAVRDPLKEFVRPSSLFCNNDTWPVCLAAAAGKLKFRDSLLPQSLFLKRNNKACARGCAL